MNKNDSDEITIIFIHLLFQHPLGNNFKKLILDIANQKYPELRKRKYSLEYYLKNFIYVLNDISKWESFPEDDKTINE